MVHFGQILFGQPEIFNRHLAGVRMEAYFHLFVTTHAHRHAALQVRAAEFEPAARAGIVASHAVDREIQVGVILPRAGDGEGISGAGIGHLEVGQVRGRPGGRRRRFLEELHQHSPQ